MNNRSLILKCIALIEEKVDWGKTHDWVDYDFKNLSHQIFKNTKVSISVRTLKRIFRQLPDSEVFYEPQMATKNALAVYLGFRNWAHFKDTHAPDLRQEPDAVVVPLKTTASKKSSKYLKGIALSAIILIVVAAYLIWQSQTKSAELTIKHISGNNVAFRYDLKGIRYNNATIDLDYGYFRPLITPKGEFTYLFKLPDNYRLKLLADGVILAAQNIHIVSNGWASVVQQGLKEVLVADTSLFHRNNALSFRQDKLRSIGLDPAEDYWVDYRNIRDFGIDGDNLIIELDIKNDLQNGGIDCFDSSIEYLGEQKTGRVKFVRPGCDKFASFDFGEVHYNGNFHDLSPLGIDLSVWKKVRIEVIQKEVNVFINGVSIYKNNYHEPIGNVKGIKCKFKGVGAIDNFKIMNTKNEVVYESSFDDMLK